MLTNCGCIANKEQTVIERACALHDQWAKAKYGLKITRETPPPFVIRDDEAER